VRFRVLWVKFIAGALQIGGGASLGREGPSVQLAGAAGSLLAAWRVNRNKASAGCGHRSGGGIGRRLQYALAGSPSCWKS